MKILIPKNMQENLREFSNKVIYAVKKAFVRTSGGIKNSAYILIPVIMLLSVGIIALTQEDPFQVDEFNAEDEDSEPAQELSYNYETDRIIPDWVKPPRWFRSNSGGMPLEEMRSRITALRGQYALLIDFTNSFDLPEYLLNFFDKKYFIEVRTLYKDGIEDRTQWIFRDENYGVRLNAVLFDAAQDTDSENKEAAPADKAETNVEVEAVNIAEETKIIAAKAGKREPASGFIEIYDDKYHLTGEYRYSGNGEKSKIVYLYNGGIKTTAQAMLWDENEKKYIQTHTDYYRYNRSSFLRAVERVFLTDQRITSADNVIADNKVADDNVVKVSFPQNILAAARGRFFKGERFNAYPDFFGDLFVLKDSKIIYTTDDHGRVLEQTLINNDEEQTIVWKIANTWSNDRIVKVTKTEGETVLMAEYVYNKSGDRVLERNIKDGVLERVVRSEGKTDIEELYLDNKVVLKAVWEDGRKISESRITKN